MREPRLPTTTSHCHSSSEGRTATATAAAAVAATTATTSTTHPLLTTHYNPLPTPPHRHLVSFLAMA